MGPHSDYLQLSANNSGVLGGNKGLWVRTWASLNEGI